MSNEIIDKPWMKHAGFWIGIVSGVASLVSVLAPDGSFKIPTVLAFFLFGFGCALISLWAVRRLEALRFPFRYDAVQVQLSFEIDQSGPRKRVVGRLNRNEKFRARTSGHTEWSRYQLVDDPITDAAAFARTIDCLEHTVEFKVNDKPYSHRPDAVALDPGLFRRVTIRGKFDSDMHPGDKWEVIETMTLNNTFDDPTEFYVIEVNEPVQRRIIMLAFRDMDVSNVTYRVRHGSYAPDKLRAELVSALGGLQTFSIDCSRAPVGARIRIEWNWPAHRLLA